MILEYEKHVEIIKIFLGSMESFSLLPEYRQAKTWSMEKVTFDPHIRFSYISSLKLPHR